MFSLFFNIKLETIIPNPKIETINETKVPKIGINLINHNTIAETISIPNIPTFLFIFNFVHNILLIAITNIEELTNNKIQNTAKDKNENATVIFNKSNIIKANINAIGVNIPKPITGNGLLVSI